MYADLMIDLYYEIRKRICPFDKIAEYIPENKNILDIGCGRGIIYKYFLSNKKYISYTGIDNNLKKINNINSDNVFFINNNIESILNNIKKYDCILMIDVMHHLNKNKQKYIIEKILTNMKYGSLLIYKDMSNKNFIKSLLNRIHDLIFNLQLINYYESKNIINFVKTKLEVSKIIEFNIQVLWYDHEFIIIQK